jgi:hypothetical protein
MCRRPAWILAILSSAFPAGCVHRSAAVSVGPDDAPAWLVKVPVEEGAAYAVGIAGPTYDPDDAVKNAADNGRVQLAHVLSTHITAVTLSVNSRSGADVDTAAVVDATHDYTDTIVQFAQVVSTWVDKSGGRSSGQAGTAYALMRLNLREAGLLASPTPRPATAPVSSLPPP